MTDLGTLGGTGAEADGQGFEPPQSEESWFDPRRGNPKAR